MIRLSAPLRAALAGALATAAAAPAAAEDWSFRVSPYVWAPWADITLDTRGTPPASGSTSLFEILDGAFLIHGVARRGKLSIFAEGNYLNLGDKGSTPGGRVSAKYRLEGFMFAGAAGWTVAQGESWTLDALAGGRFWTAETTVDLPRRSGKSDSTFFDPLVGARIGWQATDRVLVEAMADIGGFGVGSEIQWEVWARAGYQVSDLVSLSAGWRHYYVDYDDGPTGIEMELTGPYASIDFNF